MHKPLLRIFYCRAIDRGMNPHALLNIRAFLIFLIYDFAPDPS
jgi:hypothetical protein